MRGVVKILLERNGTNPNITDIFRCWALLQCAVKNGYQKIAKIVSGTGRFGSPGQSNLSINRTPDPSEPPEPPPKNGPHILIPWGNTP